MLVISLHHTVCHFVAPAIVISTKEADTTGTSTTGTTTTGTSTWDLLSMDEESLSSQSSPPVKVKAGANKNNQMIKNSMPSMLNRPSKA